MEGFYRFVFKGGATKRGRKYQYPAILYMSVSREDAARIIAGLVDDLADAAQVTCNLMLMGSLEETTALAMYDAKQIDIEEQGDAETNT